MSEKLKIKISIADRVYPLTVEPSQEEGLRSASKKIDAMIKQFEQSYAVRDKQDVLAMCALQFAAQVEQKQIILDKELFGEELFYSVENGHVYEIPNFINIILSAWDEKRLMLLIKYFGIERIKPYIVKQKDIKILKSFNQHVKYLIRKQ